jgi:hypothetical protein
MSDAALKLNRYLDEKLELKRTQRSHEREDSDLRLGQCIEKGPEFVECHHDEIVRPAGGKSSEVRRRGHADRGVHLAFSICILLPKHHQRRLHKNRHVHPQRPLANGDGSVSHWGLLAGRLNQRLGKSQNEVLKWLDRDTGFKRVALHIILEMEARPIAALAIGSEATMADAVSQLPDEIPYRVGSVADRRSEINHPSRKNSPVPNRTGGDSVKHPLMGQD